MKLSRITLAGMCCRCAAVVLSIAIRYLSASLKISDYVEQCTRCGSDFVEVFSAEQSTVAAPRDPGDRSMENRLLRHLLGSNLAGARDVPQGGGGAIGRGREVHRNIICDGCQMVAPASRPMHAPDIRAHRCSFRDFKGGYLGILREV